MPLLTSLRFTQKQAFHLLALRSRTVRGIRAVFGQMYPNQICPLDSCNHGKYLNQALFCLNLALN